MFIAFIILAAVVLFIYFFLQQPQFGRSAGAERREKISRSPNFRNGQFQNLSPTPAITEGRTYMGVMREFVFGKDKRNIPDIDIPAVKTDLFGLDPNENLIVWFGHSSYYLQLQGKTILVDPVLSGYASPLPFTTRSFKGANLYTPADIPPIDYLLISHDHYDHLDHQTMLQLRPRIGKVITGLGVGEHLEHWGFDKNDIIEKDWNETAMLSETIQLITAPARHFSGRTFKRNTTLWLSFILITPDLKIYIGGDSGYDTHFKEIGAAHGPFDLAILENGQYNENWKYIHMMPEEVVLATLDLQAKRLMPVHWSKFSLSLHAWDDSIIRVSQAAREQGMPLLHPMIGEAVPLPCTVESRIWWQKNT